MNEVRIRGAFLDVSPKEREEGVIRFRVDQRFRNILHAYGVENKKTLADQEIIIKPYTFHYSTEAIRFFHLVRDMILEKMSGPQAVRSQTEKDDLKRQLKEEFGVRDKDGELVSLTKYDRKQLWDLCQGAVEWLFDAGGDLGGLREDFEGLRNGKQERENVKTS